MDAALDVWGALLGCGRLFAVRGGTKDATSAPQGAHPAPLPAPRIAAVVIQSASGAKTKATAACGLLFLYELVFEFARCINIINKVDWTPN